jgi:cell division septum initiation protein DivIVA
LDHVVSELRTVIAGRDRLEAEVRRLQEAVVASDAAKETTTRECELMLTEARRQADEIRSSAEQEVDARREALERVETVHRLIRVELRKVLGAMLEELTTPSAVVREALKDRRLAEDLRQITRKAIEAAPSPDQLEEPRVSPDEGADETLPATAAARPLPERMTHWTSYDRDE